MFVLKKISGHLRPGHGNRIYSCSGLYIYRDRILKWDTNSKYCFTFNFYKFNDKVQINSEVSKQIIKEH